MSEQKPPADDSADNNPDVGEDGQNSLSDEALTSTAAGAPVDDLNASDSDTDAAQALEVQDSATEDKATEDKATEESADVEPEPQPDDKTESSATPPPPKAKGRFLAFLALLLALAAAAGVGYLYYELVYLKPLAQIEQTSSVLTSRYTELESELTEQLQALEQSTTRAIDSVRGEQAERLASNEDAVLASLNEALNAAPPSQREWLLAEAEYLMRVANHRVLMEQDSNGALSLLQAADQIMADLDDFALYQVRARLADEIIALRQVPRDDLQGIYLRIEAIKSQVDALPLPEPAYVEARRVEQPQVSVWQTLVDELKQFIRVRSISGEEALKPLLAPEEERYLELNLRLSLEQAQLATLKRQQEVFEQSLLNVRSWLVEHADTSDDRTKVLLSQVDELLVLELAIELPDISGSLNELLTIRRSGS